MLIKQAIIPHNLRFANTILQVRYYMRPVPDERWRSQQRLPRLSNAFGPLTDLPDYSFKDGRPVPFGVRQMIRINKQRKMLDTMKKLTGEIDHAVEKHARLQEEKARKRQSIIDNKLKPKGHLF